MKECRELLGRRASADWRVERELFQVRMSRVAAHIRSRDELRQGVREAWLQWARLASAGCAGDTPAEGREAMRNRQLCFAHAVYLEAVLFAVESGLGSRGSCIVIDPAGQPVHGKLEASQWSFAPENTRFRDQVMETLASRDGKVVSQWVPRRPMSESDLWFETAWAAYRNGEIFK